MKNESRTFRCGYVAIAGLPNVGKSTLLNRLIEEPLAIVTPKPQTTRNRILGIHTTDRFQAIFMDTPGLCDEINELNRYLNVEIGRALKDADIVLLMADARGKTHDREQRLLQKVNTSRKVIFLALNKTDVLKNREDLKSRIASLSETAAFGEIVPISALTGEGVKSLMAAVEKHLPFGPALFPPDEITTSNLRFIVAEMIRGQVLRKTQKEVPYSTAVIIETFDEAEKEGDIVRIEANIFVERDSQKGILIGAGGKMMKSIGQDARAEIENFLRRHVFLRLNVKVRKNWTQDKILLKKLGYQ